MYGGKRAAKKPFVISVSGVSGGGKTTIANALAGRLGNAAVVSFDDYEDITLDCDINAWSEDGNNENEWNVEPIVLEIERLWSEPLDYIILDYPFGYRNLRVGRYVDFAVFVDTPLDVALARRTIRDHTDFSVVEKEWRFYLERSRPTYARMPEMQKPFSDFAADGMKAPDEIADDVANVLRRSIRKGEE